MSHLIHFLRYVLRGIEIRKLMFNISVKVAILRIAQVKVIINDEIRVPLPPQVNFEKTTARFSVRPREKEFEKMQM